MKEELMTEVMRQMLPYLDNAQLKQLRQVMEQTLFHYEVTSTETKSEEDLCHVDTIGFHSYNKLMFHLLWSWLCDKSQ